MGTFSKNGKLLPILAGLVFAAVVIWIVGSNKADLLEKGEREEGVGSREVAGNKRTRLSSNRNLERRSWREEGEEGFDSREALFHCWSEGLYQEASDIFVGWLEENPEEALEYVNQMKHPMEPSHFAPAIQDYLEQVERGMALDLAAKLTNFHKTQISVTSDLVAGWIQEDPEEAIGWFEKTKQDPWVEGLAYRLGSLGSFGDEKTNLDRFASLPDGDVKNNLVSSVMSRWFYHDPENAVSYLNDCPVDEAFDKCVEELALSIVERSPAEARKWAEGISNEGARVMLLGQLDLLAATRE